MGIVREAAVSGVPTFSPTRPMKGPLHACLIFRVGRADETLATAGVTHAVEHLALSAMGSRSHGWNGAVDATFTRFFASGTPAEITDFLTAVCDGLRHLAVDRLEPELRVLRTEEQRQRPSLLGADLFQRYGAQGFGLPHLGELGLRRVDAAEVAAWASRHFTRANAALWVSGRVPRGLRLDLPDGERTPAPSRHVVLPGLPGSIGTGHDGATLSVASGGAPGVATGMRILQERALQRLRHELAITYAVEAAGVDLGEGHFLLQVVADATEEHALAVRDGLAATATDLIETGPSADEVARDVGMARRAWAEEEAVIGWLEGAASARLWGGEERSAEDVMDRWERLTAEQVGQAWAVAAETSLLMGADEATELEHWPRVADWCVAIEEGTELQPAPGGDAYGLLRVADAGLTWLPEPKCPVVVRFDELAAVQRWENGDRLLTAPTGHRIAVVPSSWWGGWDLTTFIDQRTPAHLAVDMGAGPPRPPAERPPAPQDEQPGGLRRGLRRQLVR